MQGKIGPKTRLADVVTVHEPKEELEVMLPPEPVVVAPYATAPLPTY